jgi:ribonuclease HI
MTHIYTDGACLLNYTGGLAIGLCGFYDADQEMFRVAKDLTMPTTAYIMELRAIRMALEYIKTDTIIFTDSMQALDNISTKNKKVKTEYERSVRKIFELKNKVYNIDIQWVKSHSDSSGNNLIDQKLEQEMVRLIHELPIRKRNEIIDIVQERYDRRGAFESFSVEFFERLLKC